MRAPVIPRRSPPLRFSNYSARSQVETAMISWPSRLLLNGEEVAVICLSFISMSVGGRSVPVHE